MACLALISLWVGCSEDTSIRKYTVSKKDVVRQPARTEAIGLDQRMLGVIVPHEQSAWYFKLMADPATVAKYESDFRSMVESLSFESNGDPRWKLPEGWQDEIMQQIVYARLTHKDGVSATVTQLPAKTADESSWRKNVFENVNRWRDQLSLRPQDWNSMEPELEEVSQLSQGQAKAYLVSLVGKKSAGGGMNAPFMNQMMQPGAASVPPTEAAPPETPLTQGTASEAALPSGDGLASAAPELRYDIPEGWTEETIAAGAAGIRKAAFQVASEDRSAAVVISTATVKPEMSLGMWFQQLGIEASEEAKKSVIEAASVVEVQGVEATLYTIAGDSRDSILVASLPWTERETLFVKMSGEADLVRSQKETFVGFLQSLQW